MGKREIVIISPHPDDEIIGAFEILRNPDISPVIIYTEDMNEERKEESLKLKELTKVKVQLYLRSVPPTFLNPDTTFYFPHPVYETHPAHRMQGAVGESLARSGLDVIFYITEMNAPFKYECKAPNAKRAILSQVYPSQSGLWEYEHKYFLFSGYDKWLVL